ncbi:melatonin receptor type 1B-A isoform X3 [Anguilla anguilla]|uniref:melatonin receptor type 1B-A isoform X3 n=1 Tax=Anguilla anguilla TaxID=7936 RepID=UPI0015AEC106|nr:melatonin receptor type 1B-A isoform X3 [Anguilla anguilla]
MPENVSLLRNRTELGHSRALGLGARPAWAITVLASVLIFTTVVDVLGNLLVIISVLRNRKLRNAGNVFVVSLAFADLVVAFYPYPLVLYAIFHDGWSLGDTQCKYDARIYSCTFAQTVSSSYTITVVIIHFIVPIMVVTFCYLRIWILVIQVRRKVKSEVRPRLKPSDLRNFVTMFVVFVLFAICWAPLNFIGLAVAINPTVVAPRIPEWLFVVSYFMAYFNSCLNAIIYGLLNQNFRKEYKRIVMSMWMPKLFFQETSRGGTEAMKSKPSPALNNNEQMKGETL